MLRDSHVLSVIAVIVPHRGLRPRPFRRLMTGFAQAAFPSQANGSLIKVDGKVVGSRLAAQGFTGKQYFHERPSATSPAYNARRNDLRQPRPDQPATGDQRAEEAAQAILRLEGPYNPGLTVHQIPVDAVTTLGSGIDPDISPAYAQLQARRIAAVRHLPLVAVQTADLAARRRAQPRGASSASPA